MSGGVCDRQGHAHMVHEKLNPRLQMNKKNYKMVLDKIESCPAEWDQTNWHCGTQHCFAGWAQILSGRDADVTTARRDARIFLGMSGDEADYFFGGSRTIADFRAGYDRAGYDCDGYDCDGLDKNNKPQVNL